MHAIPFATAALFLSGCVSEPLEGTLDASRTPDGLPPSVEDVCDDYAGAAYGLCTAYCEAMDCDHPDVHASTHACEQVAENFTKKTGDPLPCPIDEGNGCIDAINDTFVGLNGDGFQIDVFFNDDIIGAVALDEINPMVVFDPANASQSIVLTNLDGVSRGIIAGQATAPLPFTGLQFEYTACCDGGPCDTATVTLSGF